MWLSLILIKLYRSRHDNDIIYEGNNGECWYYEADKKETMENVRRARHIEKIHEKQAISTSYVSKSERIPSRKTSRLTVTTIGRRVDDWNF
jgi:hypothetical protein